MTYSALRLTIRVKVCKNTKARISLLQMPVVNRSGKQDVFGD